MQEARSLSNPLSTRATLRGTVSPLEHPLWAADLVGVAFSQEAEGAIEQARASLVRYAGLLATYEGACDAVEGEGGSSSRRGRLLRVREDTDRARTEARAAWRAAHAAAGSAPGDWKPALAALRELGEVVGRRRREVELAAERALRIGKLSPPDVCPVCAAALEGEVVCGCCGASARPVSLPGVAIPGTLGSYGRIRYHADGPPRTPMRRGGSVSPSGVGRTDDPSALQRFRTAIEALPDGDLSIDAALRGDLLVHRDDHVTMYYAPFDFVNEGARLAVVGVTPGPTQMVEALASARDDLRANKPALQALERVKARASFKGMRKVLASWLDELGLDERLEVESCAKLFDPRGLPLLHTTSAIRYPTFGHFGRTTAARTPRCLTTRR